MLSNPVSSAMDYDFNDPKLIELLKKLTLKSFENSTYKNQHEQFITIFNQLSNYLNIISNNIKNLPNMPQGDQVKFFHFYSIVASCINAEISNIIRSNVNEGQNYVYLYDETNKSLKEENNENSEEN